MIGSLETIKRDLVKAKLFNKGRLFLKGMPDSTYFYVDEKEGFIFVFPKLFLNPLELSKYYNGQIKSKSIDALVEKLTNIREVVVNCEDIDEIQVVRKTYFKSEKYNLIVGVVQDLSLNDSCMLVGVLNGSLVFMYNIPLGDLYHMYKVTDLTLQDDNWCIKYRGENDMFKILLDKNFNIIENS